MNLSHFFVINEILTSILLYDLKCCNTRENIYIYMQRISEYMWKEIHEFSSSSCFNMFKYLDESAI